MPIHSIAIRAKRRKACVVARDRRKNVRGGWGRLAYTMNRECAPLPIEAVLQVLEALASDSALLAGLDGEQRRRLQMAAGQLARPSAEARRRLLRSLRRADRRDRQAADQRVLDATGIRTLRRQAVFVEGAPAAAPAPV